LSHESSNGRYNNVQHHLNRSRRVASRRRSRRSRQETFVRLAPRVCLGRSPPAHFDAFLSRGTSRATRARILALFALASFCVRRAAARTRVASRSESKIILIFSTAVGWMDGWVDGWMDGTRSVRGTRALSRDERRVFASFVRSFRRRSCRPPVRPSVGRFENTIEN
jgi:hypothetical protein